MRNDKSLWIEFHFFLNVRVYNIRIQYLFGSKTFKSVNLQRLTDFFCPLKFLSDLTRLRKSVFTLSEEKEFDLNNSCMILFGSLFWSNFFNQGPLHTYTISY